MAVHLSPVKECLPRAACQPTRRTEPSLSPQFCYHLHPKIKVPDSKLKVLKLNWPICLAWFGLVRQAFKTGELKLSVFPSSGGWEGRDRGASRSHVCWAVHTKPSSGVVSPPGREQGRRDLSPLVSPEERVHKHSPHYNTAWHQPHWLSLILQVFFRWGNIVCFPWIPSKRSSWSVPKDIMPI